MFDLIVIGGGPAGLAAATQAYNSGVKNILIIERDSELGGILNQCIHNGFGLHYFKEELTGPEYAHRFIKFVEEANIKVQLNTMVLKIECGVLDNKLHKVYSVSSLFGYQELTTKSIVLAMGCRERTRGSISIPGKRPSGIFTAGSAQHYLNIEGYMVGRNVVILGSGDIGLIMARRMTLEGANVLACIELMPYSGGLTRNIVQCLEDYNIPLYLSHTIVDIHGDDRLEAVTVAKVDENRVAISGSEMIFDCDTLLLSVGLIPENELSRDAKIDIDSRTNGAIVDESMQTSVDGIFACGNVLHVHDLVDYVTEESQKAGSAAANYIKNTKKENTKFISILASKGIAYTVPQQIDVENTHDKSIDLMFRVNAIYKNVYIAVEDSKGNMLKSFSRAHMAPGEMEKISLNYDCLSNANGSINISILENI